MPKCNDCNNEADYKIEGELMHTPVCENCLHPTDTIIQEF